MFPLAALLIASAVSTHAPLQQRECLSEYGRTECGYSCVAGSGRVQCAQTPRGACIAKYGRILCWDPPAEDYDRYGYSLPQGECLEASGQLKCGYSCIAAYGKLVCAEKPWSVCYEASGRVACWAPERPPVAHLSHGREAQCVSNYGKTVCGFACVTESGRTECAETQLGACIAQYGRILCWDPPARDFETYGRRLPSATCLSEYGKLSCGYSCIAAYGKLVCTDDPTKVCFETHGRIDCK